MPGRTDELARAAIARYDLHDHGVPVDLVRKLRRSFPIVYRDLTETGLYAFALLRDREDLPGPTRPAMIVVHGGLEEEDERIAYAHEVGHALLGHCGSLQTLNVDEWFHSRDEYEAWEIASALLVPYDIMVGRWSWTEQEIAALCEVPVELVQIHPGLRS